MGGGVGDGTVWRWSAGSASSPERWTGTYSVFTYIHSSDREVYRFDPGAPGLTTHRSSLVFSSSCYCVFGFSSPWREIQREKLFIGLRMAWHDQWWGVANYFYPSIVLSWKKNLRYLFLTWIFPFSAALYLHSTSFWRKIMSFLTHYIYLIT